MPLRKTGTIIPASALALAMSAAILPATASAGLFSSTTQTVTSTAASTAASVINLPSPGAPACTPVPTKQSFAKFGDTADYYLAPGGSFESGTTTGWKFTTGAKIVSGNETLGVASGSKSLSLPFGATATSPAFCVDETQPSFRFAAKVSSLDGGYAAIVLYRDSAGKVTQAQFTASGAGTYYNKATTWNPSAILPLATKIPLVNGGKTASVQLMFVGTTKAYGMFVGAKATIDSVMVDPYRRG